MRLHFLMSVHYKKNQGLFEIHFVEQRILHKKLICLCRGSVENSRLIDNNINNCKHKKTTQKI
jgi:hypothetical protein